jgi:signal peptidase II
MHAIPKIILILMIVVIFVGCDQTTKAIAQHHLKYASPIYFWKGFIQLHYAENEGGFLSLGSTLPRQVRKTATVIATIVVVTGLFGLIIYAQRLKIFSLVTYSMLIAGALGNLIDRLLREGRVIDFVTIGTEQVHTGIFNVADLLLITGALMMLAEQIFKKDTEMNPLDM